MKIKLLLFSALLFVPVYLVSAQSTEEVNSKIKKYYLAGKYEKAIILARKTLEETYNKYGKTSEEYIVNSINLAELYRKTGVYGKAEKKLLEIKKNSEKLYGKEHPVYSFVCNNLGVLYSETGNYNEAEILLIKAKKIREKTFGKQDQYYAESCNNLAELYFSLGNFKKTEDLLNEAKEIYKQLNYKQFYASTCNNLAEFYNTTGKFKKAEPLLIETKHIIAKTLGKKHPNYALTCNNLAQNYFKTGKYKDAEKLFVEAKKIYEKVYGNKHILYANVCNNLGVLYTTVGKYQKSELLFTEAKTVIKEKYGIKHPYYVDICGNLAGLYEIFGNNEQNPVKAEEFYQKSENLYLESNGILKSLINESEKFMSENEREDFLFHRINVKFDKSFSFLLTKRKDKKYLGGIIYDDLLQIKSQLLKSSLAIRKAALQSGDASLLEAYNKMNFYGRILNKQDLLPIEQRRSDIQQIKEKLNAAEKTLTRNSEIYTEHFISRQYYWQEIRMFLNKDDAAIEFFRFRYRNNLKQTDSILYYAIILKRNSLNPEAVFLFEQKQLENLLKRKTDLSEYEYIKNLYDPKSKKADSLYKLVWQPLEARLKNIKNIYISPAGLLSKISFDAIPYDTENLLSDKYKIIYTSTTREVINKEGLYQKDIKNSVLFGGINYDFNSEISDKDKSEKEDTLDVNDKPSKIIPDSLTRNITWSYLPGSFDEVNEIKKLTEDAKINVRLFSGDRADEEHFKALEKYAPSILHLSTHGFYFKNTEETETEGFAEDLKFKHFANPLLRSGFLLAGGNRAFSGTKIPEGKEDGLLTAAEISRLNFFNTKLVVLSACQTGLGDVKGNEGVYGLQRAFKMAGVRYLLFSLWSVPDEATKELMVTFYKNWFSGDEIRDAFKKTQNHLKEKYKGVPGAAFAWAAFVLMK